MKFKYKRAIAFLVILFLIKSNPQSHVYLTHNGSFPSLSKMKAHPENDDGEDRAVMTNGKKHLLILAATRTGSSFVGEFFNQQRDNMSYLYEPLWYVERMLTVDGRINVTATDMVYPDVLRELFLCNFSLLENFIQPRPVDHIMKRFFRRHVSSSLCEESVCSPPIRRDSKTPNCGTRDCGPLNLTMASELCLQKKHRVIKVVRVYHFHILQPLAEDPSLDIKFLQLVRDPRAIIASRMEAFGRYENLKKWGNGEDVPLDENDLKKVKTTCETVRRSAELGLSQPPWLHRRYMLVRYEDIARFPMKKAAEMYQFSGIPFTPEMKSWILNSTSKETWGSYSTQKRSFEHVDKWRFTLPFKVVQVIQRICLPTIKFFGYKIVTSEEMLRNKFVSLIVDKDSSISWT
uniref:Sulfotransferase n=1 Tax=Salarias fasciatus TaxID=181472 RepID=A0A672J6Z3_SALFA